MKLLLVNDDGIFAPGMKALIDSVEGQCQYTVIAPNQERSATSQAITVHQPLRLTQIEEGYMLDGTPTDCVKMGLQGLKLKPDFVLAGINRGSNLGTDVLYSGTVAAALEAVILGVPALAFSLCGPAQFMPTAVQIAKRLLFEKPGILLNPQIIPTSGILNINIPGLPVEDIKGTRVTRLGVRKYHNVLQRREDPRGSFYYWMAGEPAPLDLNRADIDLAAVEQGYVSVTPLQFDLTFYAEIPRLDKIFGKN